MIKLKKCKEKWIISSFNEYFLQLIDLKQVSPIRKSKNHV